MAVLVDALSIQGAKALRVPEDLTLLPLPPSSPELNPAERLWWCLRRHHLSNQVLEDYDDLRIMTNLLEQTTRAYDQLDNKTRKSACACPWMERALQS